MELRALEGGSTGQMQISAELVPIPDASGCVPDASGCVSDASGCVGILNSAKRRSLHFEYV